MGAGFSLAELGDMTPDAWTRLHAAAMSRRYSDAVLAMTVMHPGKSPAATQKRLAKAAGKMLRTAALAEEEVEVWRDPKRLMVALGRAGMSFRKKKMEGSAKT